MTRLVTEICGHPTSHSFPRYPCAGACARRLRSPRAVGPKLPRQRSARLGPGLKGRGDPVAGWPIRCSAGPSRRAGRARWGDAGRSRCRGVTRGWSTLETRPCGGSGGSRLCRTGAVGVEQREAIVASEGDDIAAAARVGIGGTEDATEDGTARAVSRGGPTHPGETHAGGLSSRLNWLRAGVLGANDGIVSVAGLVVGVAGATSERGPSSSPASRV